MRFPQPRRSQFQRPHPRFPRPAIPQLHLYHPVISTRNLPYRELRQRPRRIGTGSLDNSQTEGKIHKFAKGGREEERCEDHVWLGHREGRGRGSPRTPQGCIRFRDWKRCVRVFDECPCFRSIPSCVEPNRVERSRHSKIPPPPSQLSFGWLYV